MCRLRHTTATTHHKLRLMQLAAMLQLTTLNFWPRVLRTVKSNTINWRVTTRPIRHWVRRIIGLGLMRRMGTGVLAPIMMRITHLTPIGPGSGLAAVTPTCGTVTRITGPRCALTTVMAHTLRRVVLRTSGIRPHLSGNSIKAMMPFLEVRRRGTALR